MGTTPVILNVMMWMGLDTHPPHPTFSSIAGAFPSNQHGATTRPNHPGRESDRAVAQGAMGGTAVGPFAGIMIADEEERVVGNGRRCPPSSAPPPLCFLFARQVLPPFRRSGTKQALGGHCFLGVHHAACVAGRVASLCVLADFPRFCCPSKPQHHTTDSRHVAVVSVSATPGPHRQQRPKDSCCA